MFRSWAPHACLVGALTLLTCFLTSSFAEEAFCGGAEVYNTTSQRRPGVLNVHVIPHTHDDAGWLKSIDQYYFGDAQYIQPAGVQYELDSVVESLYANPDRRFIYSDIGFFSMWWAEQNPSMRARTRALVADGRLSFVNGGWVQHDEACPSWEAMVDNWSRGHRFLNSTFGPSALPTISWQIDPFGHSATHASLMRMAGFDAVYFARMDFKEVEARAPVRAIEHLWRGEPSFGESADVFAGNFIQGNYTMPYGFQFDWLQADPPFIDNVCAAPGVNNVKERVDVFVQKVRELAKPVQGKDVAVYAGADFQHAAAAIYAKNLDKLIHHVNADGRVNAFYSTPAAYTAAKAATKNVDWALKTDDFFPMANDADSTWVGYFTSRPGLKRAIFAATCTLAAARQLAVVHGQDTAAAWSAALDRYEAEVAFGAHHDTITGTSKQHVTNNYLARLARARDGLDPLLGDALKKAAGLGDSPTPVAWCHALNASVCAPTARASAAGRGFTVLLYNALGATRTEGVRLPIAGGDGTAWRVTGPGGETIPSQFIAASPGDRTAAASLVAAGGAESGDAPESQLAFVVTLPPLSAAAFVVSPGAAGDAGSAAPSEPVGPGWSDKPRADSSLRTPGETLTLGPSPVNDSSSSSKDGDAAAPASATLTVDAASGELVRLASARQSAPSKDASSSSSTSLTSVDGFDIAMGYYKAADDNAKGIAGGAYIMRTDDSPLYTGFDLDDGGKGAGPPTRSAYTGPVLASYSVSFSPYASATVRLWAGLPDAEVEWTVGPLPSADQVGREMVVSYSAAGLGDTGAGSLWTDANGRRNMKRVRDKRPSFVPDLRQETAANFYPVTSAATVEAVASSASSATPRLALTAVTDRAQAASSSGDGNLQFLVHRRLFKDDWKGVNEPLNETECGCTPAWSTAGATGYSDCQCGGVVATGSHTLVLAPAGPDGAAVRRAAQARASRPLLVGILDGEVSLPPAASSALSADLADAGGLPANVHLVTLAPAGRPGAPDGRVLLRLAHTFGAGEHPDLSAPVTVDLNALLREAEWADVTETTLTAARPLADAPAPLTFRAGAALDLGDAAAKQAAAAIPAGAGPAVPAQPADCTAGEGCASKSLPVTLGPMQIRTFLVTPSAA